VQPFSYIDGRLHCEEVPAETIARDVGTPAYVYSASGILRQYQNARNAFPDALICFSVKSNPSGAILRLLAEQGSGFDVVSQGELARVIAAGANAEKTVFAGVGKSDEEIRYALDKGILTFNVESPEELWNIGRIAQGMGTEAPVCLRINPDVDAGTHSHMTTGKQGVKFGMDLEQALSALDELPRHAGLRLAGVHMHIGSQILSTEPYVNAVRELGRLVPVAAEKGFELEYFNIGGGYGIDYTGDGAPSFKDFAEAILPEVEEHKLKLILEPGRSIVGNNGVLLTEVLYVDRSGGKNFVICNAGMNDLIRPVLYDAYHRIWPIAADHETPSEGDASVDVVGPVCETGDFFAHDRRLPAVKRGDILAIFGAGAYAFAMSSNYNSRPRPCEVLVDCHIYSVVRKRETVQDLMQGEVIPEAL